MCLTVTSVLQKLSAYNTRLFKKENGAKTCYEVRLASAVKKGQSSNEITQIASVRVTVTLTRCMQDIVLTHLTAKQTARWMASVNPAAGALILREKSSP